MDKNSESLQPANMVPPLQTLAKSDLPFSGPQLKVLHGMGDGNSVTKAARLAGVHRTTVHVWRKENPDYEAAFQEWKRQGRENARAGVYSLTDLALRTVKKDMLKGGVKTALTILESVGALDRDTADPTTGDEISDERTLKAEEKRIRRDERRQKLLDRHLKNAAARSEMQNAVAGAMANPASRHNALPAPNPAPSAEDEEEADPDDLGSEESGQFSDEQMEQLKEILWEQKQQEKTQDPEPTTKDDKPAVE